MYYFLSIALILGGAFFAWKPHVWLELTQCRCGSCKKRPLGGDSHPGYRHKLSGSGHRLPDPVGFLPVNVPGIDTFAGKPGTLPPTTGGVPE